MGEGGCPRADFLERMQWLEIRRYIAGLRRRERAGWSMTRLHAWLVLSALGCKAGSPEEFLPFHWERQEEDEENEEDEAERLEALRQWAEDYNRRKDNEDGDPKNLL